MVNMLITSIRQVFHSCLLRSVTTGTPSSSQSEVGSNGEEEASFVVAVSEKTVLGEGCRRLISALLESNNYENQLVLLMSPSDVSMFLGLG